MPETQPLHSASGPCDLCRIIAQVFQQVPACSCGSDCHLTAFLPFLRQKAHRPQLSSSPLSRLWDRLLEKNLKYYSEPGNHTSKSLNSTAPAFHQLESCQGINVEISKGRDLPQLSPRSWEWGCPLLIV